MPKVQVTSQIEIDLDEVVHGLAQLGTRESEQFADKVVALQAQRRAPSLPKVVSYPPRSTSRRPPRYPLAAEKMIKVMLFPIIAMCTASWVHLCLTCSACGAVLHGLELPTRMWTSGSWIFCAREGGRTAHVNATRGI